MGVAGLPESGSDTALLPDLLLLAKNIRAILYCFVGPVKPYIALEDSRNLSATMVLAHLRAQATQRDPQARLAAKLTVLRRL
jgi:hypothetical protein